MKKSILAVMMTAALLAGCNENDDKEVVAVNEAPNIIPTLNFWKGKTGFTDVTAESRIIINADDAATLEILQGTAGIFNEDLLVLNGLQLEVIENGGEGQPGDIVFNITGFEPPEHDPAAHDESYNMDIDGKIVITAPEVRGAAYASATLKQMLIQDADGKDSLLNGLIQDKPAVRVRGFMLDMGRRSMSVDFLKNYLKFMSYYKMSELQMHVNDNKILKGDGLPDDPESNWSEETWADDHALFAIELEDTEEFPELSTIAAEHDPGNNIFVLSIDDVKELRALADSLGIELTLEIEAPAHAGSFTQAYPDIRHPDLKPDHLDLGNPKTLEVVKAVWDQLSPYFHNAHIGADEYAGDPTDWTVPSTISEELVNYMNEMNDYLTAKDFTEVRVWGNYGQLAFPNRDALSKEIVQQPWWGQPAQTQQAYEDGFTLINTNHIWYTVPTAGACYQDMQEPENMYANYRVDEFAGWERDTNEWGVDAPLIIDVDDPQFLGATIALWNDNGHYQEYAYSDHDLHERLRNKIKIAAQSMWSNKTVLPFEKFQTLAYNLGESPSFTISDSEPTDNLARRQPAYSSSYQTITEQPYGCSGQTEDIDMGELKDMNFIGHAGSAVDGFVKSRWIAAEKDGPSAWISVDLQTPESISRVSVDWGVGWASEYRIETSNDGVTWQTAAAVNGAGANNEETSFSPVTGRFVRIQGVAMGTEEPYQIHDIRIFN
ncbi:family 20 glycosylhydrolase [Psychromonas ossibalaenae]|uniref:family 20 glycosylhydrolase n=1 Tax=Psychromonas ossibalaenae TaxID=444922 RepID=UPI00037A630D|nr:family 20 glycosylhydrolase [Psychromonas ossibalaenae]